MVRNYFFLAAVVLTAVFSIDGTRRASAEEFEFESEHAAICRYCRASREHAALTPFSAAADTEGRQYAPDRQVDVLHIKLDVTPDFEKRTIAGTTTIRFSPISQPLKELRLDAYHLSIADVRSGSDVADYISTDQDLTIVFKDAVPVGEEATIEVDHSAEPTMGFYFRTPEMGYPETDTHCWTQGETHEARHWFPCFDYPNERSSTEVICHVPRDMTVLSNGRRMSEEFDEDTKLKSVRWLHEKPHVNYLICLVAGHLEKLEDKHRDVPLAFYSQPSLIEHAPNSFVDTADIMAYFEEEIGVNFPWNKYYQVTIRDFTAGGMENTTLTTLTHGTIFSKETENLRSTRSLDAHEMAHQWFGDYVTCKDWSHLWLNEGFATYYSHLYDGHKFGKDELLYDMYRDATGRVLPGGKRNRNPIVYKDYKNPGEQFDFRSYPKGSWVLHMLRNQLGTDLYRKCIKTYLERNALSSVVTEELNEVIEELSGRSYDRFFDQWVYNGGHPELEIAYRWLADDKLARVTVTQTQKTEDGVGVFQFPTKLRFIMEDGKVVDHEIEITGTGHEFYVSLPDDPAIVRFDPDYSVLAEVTFAKSDRMLMAQLQNSDDIIGRLLAVKGLQTRRTQKSVNALKKVLNEDGHHGVRRSAATALRTIGTDNAFEAILDSREQSDARVRNSVVGAIGRFYRPEAMKALVEVVEKETNPDIVSSAIRSLGKFQDDESIAVIRRSLRHESFGNRVALSAVSALGDHADSSEIPELLDVLESRRDELSNRGYGRALGTLAKLGRTLGDDENSQKIRGRVRKFLHKEAGDSDSPIRAAAITAIGEFGDSGSVPMLKSLTDENRKDGVGKAARAALESVTAKKDFVPKEVNEMRSQIAELKRSQEKLRDELKELREKKAAVADGEKNAKGEDGSGDDAKGDDKDGDKDKE